MFRLSELIKNHLRKSKRYKDMAKKPRSLLNDSGLIFITRGTRRSPRPAENCFRQSITEIHRCVSAQPMLLLSAFGADLSQICEALTFRKYTKPHPDTLTIQTHQSRERHGIISGNILYCNYEKRECKTTGSRDKGFTTSSI